jgi:precorrin-6Y C5,15-methyltransferase (decarboxylating)
MARVSVIGIGYRPLDKETRGKVCTAEVILASERLFEVFKRYEEFGSVEERVQVINDVDATMSFIKSRIPSLKSHVVLLASGDPLFSGIGRRALDEFGKEMVEIIPDLSSVQIAFARIKEPWDDAFLMSLHRGPDAQKRRRLKYEVSDIPSILREYETVAILTDRENNPATIAKEIVRSSANSQQPSAIGIYVCERLGYPDERITVGSPECIAQMEFSEPNVVIIKRNAKVKGKRQMA